MIGYVFHKHTIFIKYIHGIYCLIVTIKHAFSCHICLITLYFMKNMILSIIDEMHENMII